MLTKTERSNRMSLSIAAVLVLGLGLAACNGGGLDRAEADALRDRVPMLQQRLDNVDAMVEDARQDSEGEAQALLEEVRAELVETRALLDDMRAQLEPPPAATEPVDPAAPAAPAAPGGF